MIRVVITGSECTGKTTLAAGLAARYRTVWVPEYARRFVQERASAPGPDDVAEIARGQIETEDLLAAAARRVLVLDTDLLSTIVYANHYYGRCPGWIPGALDRRPGHLYLLCGIDVPWVADGLQRDRGDRREAMHELFRSALVERSLPFVELVGAPAERLERAATAIERTLAATSGPAPPPRGCGS